MSKYKNVKIEIDGIKFDSKKEGYRYAELKLLEKSGVISDLKRQVIFELQPSFYFKGKKERSIKYVADFTYIQNGEYIIEDVKSPITKNNQVYKMKRKMMRYRGYDIKEV